MLLLRVSYVVVFQNIRKRFNILWGINFIHYKAYSALRRSDRRGVGCSESKVELTFVVYACQSSALSEKCFSKRGMVVFFGTRLLFVQKKTLIKFSLRAENYLDRFEQFHCRCQFKLIFKW